MNENENVDLVTWRHPTSGSVVTTTRSLRDKILGGGRERPSPAELAALPELDEEDSDE